MTGAVVAGKHAVDLVGGLDKANKLSESGIPKQFHTGSAENVAKFNQAMQTDPQANKASKISELKPTDKTATVGNYGAQAHAAVPTKGNMILDSFHQLRAEYQGSLSSIKASLHQAESSKGFNMPDMIGAQYGIMQISAMEGYVTGAISNLKGTAQQLLSAQ